MGSNPVATLLIPAFLIIVLLRYLSVLLNDYANKGKSMSKSIRHVVVFSSCCVESLWAGVVSVVVGMMPGSVKSILALAKSI
jgi:hypothetical protein|nr:MAG TPA: hypothetical protein [Caudoviricetes sp.]